MKYDYEVTFIVKGTVDIPEYYNYDDQVRVISEDAVDTVEMNGEIIDVDYWESCNGDYDDNYM